VFERGRRSTIKREMRSVIEREKNEHEKGWRKERMKMSDQGGGYKAEDAIEEVGQQPSRRRKTKSYRWMGNQGGGRGYN